MQTHPSQDACCSESLTFYQTSVALQRKSNFMFGKCARKIIIHEKNHEWYVKEAGLREHVTKSTPSFSSVCVNDSNSVQFGTVGLNMAQRPAKTPVSTAWMRPLPAPAALEVWPEIELNSWGVRSWLRCPSDPGGEKRSGSSALR